MHLKQLKLAGFKSFVDPAVVHFPSQLVAVVGPNGCGKSNIIDAVRWVMGESSAKNLRGESMTDVIFNGASNRKPVGQASVELVFDNSLGRLTGPFASYGEIVVKRLVTRDGDSSYYLNGGRCRRRDITDIFLGTGAGSRGYSIIGQGTISRLIEAKPEELRAFLEEAAGVSKYKERRRETLQRIEHTRDNLNRVADIREELEKQLQRLERQAKSAERYTALKEEEKICRAEILALKWGEYTEHQSVKQRELQDLAVRYEQQQSVLVGCNTERTILNEKLQDAHDNSQQIQAAFYQLGTEIARLEESIQQQDREKKRLEQDRQQMHEDWQIAQEQLKQDKEDLQSSQQQAMHLEEQLQQLKIKFKAKEGQWQESQKQQSEQQLRWQEVQNATNSVKNELQIAQITIQHLEQKRQQIGLRLEKLSQEQALISLVDLQHTKVDLEKKQCQLKETQAFDEGQLKQRNEQSNLLRSQLQETELQLHQLQDDFHRQNSEYAALMAAQKAARQSHDRNKQIIEEWSDKPKLMDILQVEPQWQSVCEMVLTDALHAYVLDDFEELWPQWSICKAQGVSVVTMRASLDQQGPYPSLADQIKGSIPLSIPGLEHVYTAKHLEEAISLLPHLAEHESVVTTHGFWLGKGWVKLAHSEEQDELGFLGRRQNIADMSVVVDELQQKITEKRTQRDQYHAQLQHSVNDVELYQLNLAGSNEALRSNMNALAVNEQAIQHAERQKVLMSTEQEELYSSMEEATAELLQCTEKVSVLESQFKSYEVQQRQCLSDKQNGFDALGIQSKAMEEVRIALHQTEKEYDREIIKAQQLNDRIDREQERLNLLQERLEHVALLCLQSVRPETGFREQLAEQLMKHKEIELQLIHSHEQLALFKNELELLEQSILNYDQEVKQVHDLIAQARMQEQELSIRSSSVQESLDELGLQASSLLEHIPQGTTQSMREDELIALSGKIKGLGAINLAAIEEFATERQRKLYLDEQYEDLNQALAILETAIDKMDKETRLRLENTFDEVNTSFKALFPRLFGGGRAQLELTCDNLLEAGIVVMAQPPGKRNSTIHLLSGGEKAMTAVALVFAIFRLNPSPFCMLDEVDAPLDDVNVGRFCDLVNEMSQFVQFLFITHNKITMELADHLIGVTMREPGVSRLVAVDVKEALRME
jgi:chromosome segregation protein